ncbi:glucose 1-dehydrogenase [Pseudoroseomonas cervicalis]|uniref:Oxidoreductase, short chain dehydrogenase/reductase family protein n=1 Tax=Pseudoroseomonas cervicalis ATCC 49957 TaxID=525371 RepID=D5RJ31_9PROT|nr:glucose 1-dehydrogenase [Pseudoroseomonas cervicalis]EFH12678.1 oxidoreductase, short chain dehydrogenase/reductase family protein [Pseudoroseomonas cervicalis ATCC 49957]
MRLQGKIALVTGAASGFGEGIVRRFAQEGAKVAVADLNLAGAERVAAELGGGAIAIGGDVSKAEDVQAMVDQTVSAFGGLDIVVNNAGTTHKNGPILEVDEATFDKVYAVNVKSIFHMTRAALPLLREQGRGGSFINISSTAGIRPRPGLVWYNGTKGAVNTITQAMAQELARDNIRVNAICPVMGATGLIADFMGMEDTPENRQKFLATIPLGRLSTPHDIANACVWLAEDQTSFITGVLLPVDGGRTA